MVARGAYEPVSLAESKDGIFSPLKATAWNKKSSRHDSGHRAVNVDRKIPLSNRARHSADAWLGSRRAALCF
jgi:hypothetical protein